MVKPIRLQETLIKSTGKVVNTVSISGTERTIECTVLGWIRNTRLLGGEVGGVGTRGSTISRCREVVVRSVLSVVVTVTGSPSTPSLVTRNWTQIQLGSSTVSRKSGTRSPGTVGSVSRLCNGDVESDGGCSSGTITASGAVVSSTVGVDTGWAELGLIGDSTNSSSTRIKGGCSSIVALVSNTTLSTRGPRSPGGLGAIDRTTTSVTWLRISSVSSTRSSSVGGGLVNVSRTGNGSISTSLGAR
jgi:hypothetical protein